ncbi:ABC transporter ATP-binding protein [Planotetraspora sp. A-T 1434]|uniref:dipeptide ABC transporter ATP-binding protein n=1 Tax=Planotetraspora sp. A-T 1434 TaxID=2979219 RepID=UPI0021BF596C|nr:ABC transporter ATP-binding protein [Planotetraspora sp. A-T 1434]MCT9934577.1 ABC transporter ATP-binding protein [Planotetraspora sp. A-T 1434]
MTPAGRGPLVAVRDLTVRFPTRHGVVEAVRGVSFRVERGQVVAIVGESGSGKSVTARGLVGLTGEGARVGAAELTFDGVDLRQVRGRAWRALRGRRVGFVLQDALGSLDPLRRVGAEVAEPLRAHRIVPGRQVDAEVVRLLGEAGIPAPESRARQYPHQLSGGLRQRALIASALAARPDLLIADEPTTALDATVQRQVLALLRERVDDGTAVLLISHDLGVVAEIADHVYVMKDGRFVEDGPAAAVLESPSHPYTKTLVGAVAWHGRAARPGRASPAGPEDVGPGNAGTAREVLRAEGLVKRYTLPGRGEFTAVEDVSVTVRAGETLGVVGESGSGKTTLGRLLMGLLEPDAGRVLLDGRPWDGLRGPARRAARRGVQMIYQHPLSSFDPRYTARQILEEPLRADRAPREERDRRVALLLEHVGLAPDVLDRRARELSGGQRQRLAIARALAPGPQVIVCDEPVSALDASIQAQVLDVLADVQERLGVAYVFVSHDLAVIRRLSHRVMVMKDGRVVESGEMEKVFDHPEHPYTKALIDAVPRFASRFRRVSRGAGVTGA